VSRLETRAGRPAKKPTSDPVADARLARVLREVAAPVWTSLANVSIGATYLTRGSERSLVKLTEEVSCTASFYARDAEGVWRALAAWPTWVDREARSSAIDGVLRTPDDPASGVPRGGARLALATFDREDLRAHLAWTHFQVHDGAAEVRVVAGPCVPAYRLDR
jgi:hypothetical protein